MSVGTIIWTIVIGFVAGVVAKFLYPGGNEPAGFILTAILGIVGAFVATYLGLLIGWYYAYANDERRYLRSHPPVGDE